MLETGRGSSDLHQQVKQLTPRRSDRGAKRHGTTAARGGNPGCIEYYRPRVETFIGQKFEVTKASTVVAVPTDIRYKDIGTERWQVFASFTSASTFNYYRARPFQFLGIPLDYKGIVIYPHHL